jgi:predicted AAA+ superfamily ATPase
MYERLLKKPLENQNSFFLFGARGTGKSYWLKNNVKDSIIFNLLEAELKMEFSLRPENLERQIPPGYQGWIILDEIQTAPNLLDTVHRLIEEKSYKFILTSSSARKLKKLGVNLLAGRAHIYHMYPLTSKELKKDFELKTALSKGMLPTIYKSGPSAATKYLNSYAKTYLHEEIMQEGLSRNLEAFILIYLKICC